MFVKGVGDLSQGSGLRAQGSVERGPDPLLSPEPKP